MLAFVGPPAAFPVSQYNVKLQKYVKWSDNYSKMADDFIQQNVPERPFLGIHLRNGPDFVSARSKFSFSFYELRNVRFFGCFLPSEREVANKTADHPVL